MNTDKNQALFLICVHLCSSVANNVLPRAEGSSSRFQETGRTPQRALGGAKSALDTFSSRMAGLH
jgi:hypothetical protein